MIRHFNVVVFGLKSNLVVIDLHEGEQKQGGNNSSSYNTANVEATATLVKKLLATFHGDESFRNEFKANDICIFTFYTAQERLHREAMDALNREFGDLGANLVKIATVGKFQGYESQIVNLDTVVVHALGFLNGSGRRNAGLIRAQNGLYVIVNRRRFVEAVLRHPRPDTVVEYIFMNWESRRLFVLPPFIVEQLEKWAKKQKEDNELKEKEPRERLKARGYRARRQ